MEEKFLLNIVSLQFALFFRDIVERPDLDFADINSNLMNIFDAIPTTIDIPRQLPSDIPVVTQRSSSNEYSCGISRSRIDLHFQRINDNKSNSELLADFNSKVTGLVAYVMKKRNLTRFGMICRYFHPHDNPTEAIKNKYFKDCIGDIAELSFRYNKKQPVQGWIINDMVDITSTFVVLTEAEKTGVFVQRDINNDVITDKILSEKELLEISKMFSDQLTEKSIEELIR